MARVRNRVRAVSTDPDSERGLYGKYRVEKINGKPVGTCFVLEERDPHAVAALRAYAESCIGDFPRLATDLEDLADCWEDEQLGDACAL
jgi:hypothetical protein